MGNGNLTVYFKMWGQLCSTEFDAVSELSPHEWLEMMEDKGWLLPVEIVTPDGIVIWSKEEDE